MSTRSREYEYGKIVSVDVVPLGDNLAADVAIGATSITVEDAADFDEDGGLLLLGGIVYGYSTWTEDDDTGIGTITLTSALTADASENDAVAVYDPLYSTAATDKVAQVEVIGDDGNVDMLEADIALHLVDKIEEGVRGNNGEQVKLELEGDRWAIVDISGMGKAESSGTLFKRDAMTVSATGTQTFTLSYEPIPDSLHVRWEPINMDDTEWTLAGKVLTIPATLNPFEVGDTITAKYAYLKGVTNPINVQFAAGGWRYLVVAEGSTTDYSSPSFDDSAWSVSTGPIGYPLSLDPGPEVWPVATTSTGSLNVGFWMRKTIVVPPGPSVTVNVRARPDGQYWLYADGTLLASYTGSGTTGTTVGPFAVSMAPGTHVIAFHVNDDIPDPGTDYIYGDVEVIQ
jgi:hypothetical protein